MVSEALDYVLFYKIKSRMYSLKLQFLSPFPLLSSFPYCLHFLKYGENLFSQMLESQICWKNQEKCGPESKVADCRRGGKTPKHKISKPVT